MASGTPFGLLMHPTTWDAFAARLAIAPDESGMRVNMVNGLRVGTYPFFPLGYVQCLMREEWEALFYRPLLGITNFGEITDPPLRRPVDIRPLVRHDVELL